MSHLIIKKNKTELETAIQKVIKADEDTLATLRIILGIQLVNDFEVGTEDRSMEEKGTSNSVSIRALFALASMPSHSCVANATHDFAPR